MVTAVQIATAIRLAQVGIKAYKQYKSSYKGKAKRKRNKMNKNLNKGWGSK